MPASFRREVAAADELEDEDVEYMSGESSGKYKLHATEAVKAERATREAVEGMFCWR